MSEKKSPTKFDKATCIYARELRRAGFPLPAIVPDNAWVTRASMKTFSDGARYSDEKFGERFGSFSMDLHVTFTEPFRLDDDRFEADAG